MPAPGAKPSATQPPQGAAQTQPATSPDAGVAPLVRRLLDDPLTSEAEKQRLRLFHGQWEALGETDELPAKRRAQLALMRWDLEAPVFEKPGVPAGLKAKAALRRGEPQRVLTLLSEAEGIEARWLKARAYQQSGRRGRAVAALTPVRERLLSHQVHTAPALTAGAKALALLARLEGRPAADYHLVMRLLGKVHQQIDPLYWPALLAEADLLLTKHNRKQAIAALKQALRLNPRAGRGWFLWGRYAAAHFNFERAEKAVKALKQINPDHPLAARLQARIALQQREPERARAALKPVLEKYPTNRQALALQAAVEGLAYDEAAMRAVFSRFRELAPGSALAQTTAGQFLSVARQYETAEQVLRTAVERAPNWPEPRNELGLLLMQMGELEAASQVLTRATQLDPFQKRTANQLDLVQTLLDYQTIESEHFIIHYKPGVDEVLARDMPRPLERMYDQITAVFSHEPDEKTQIDLMPSDRDFAVRITGMPDIWTIAASTGPVIAMTPPRAGRHQRGAFDWANVVRHEFVHTVTLDRTANRLPHWFTEGAAVAQETTGRSFSDCKLLTWAMLNDELFPLNEINWGFIRPESKRDRPLAYAQAHWIIEYLTKKHGHSAVLQLMRLYNDGVGNVAAMEKVTGKSADAFFEDFRRWARRQVDQWGMARPLADQKAMRVMIEARPPQTAQELLAVWRQGEVSPDTLKARAQAQMKQIEASAPGTQPGDAEAELSRSQSQRPMQSNKAAYRRAREAVMRYAEARPVDPWADRALARLALALGKTQQAIGALERLDRVESKHGTWAFQLARLHRRAGNLAAAYVAIQNALDREPYNARYRELAATLALQRQKPKQALHHLKAMPILEPKEATHHLRLAALQQQLGHAEKAREHAKQARQLNEEAPVDRFLR